MKISDTLGIQSGDIVAFVGAGGKSSTMLRLASELTAQGLRVLSTTIGKARHDIDSSVKQFAMGAAQLPPPALADTLQQHGHVYVYQKLLRDGNLQGLRAEWFNEHIAYAPWVDVILVEADSANGLSLKGPLASEPSIPTTATLVVIVAGLDVLGQPLNANHVYGLDVITDITGWPVGTEIVPQLVAQVLIDAQLGLKGVPQGMRVVALLNKVDTVELFAAANHIASLVLEWSSAHRVAIGSVLNDDPITEVHRRVDAIVLAAGLSTRMGRTKALLPWGERTLLRYICEVIAMTGLHTSVVLGYKANSIADTLIGLNVDTLYNENYETGEMLSSLQLGLKALQHSNADACMVLLGDQPAIRPEMIYALWQAHREGRGKNIRPVFDGQPGHPILIDRVFWDEIIELPPGSTPQEVIAAHSDDLYIMEVDTPAVVQDLDTPEAYEAALKEFEAGGMG